MTVKGMAFMQTAYRNTYINYANSVKSLQKVSSGLRINNAADDTAGLAVSEKMRGQLGGLNKAYENSMQGISMAQTAEGYMSSSSDILVRMAELAVQSSNASYTDEDRLLISKEFDALKDELSRISGAAQYNGMNLLDGSMSNVFFQVGANGGADQRISMGFGDMSAMGLGLANADISTIGGANAAIASIKSAATITNSQRATVGATQNRLEATVKSLGTSLENLYQSESAIRDADVAKEMMSYMQNSIMLQASQAMLSQGINLSQQNMLGLLLR